jgi:ribosomal protein S18 acetylase RimI-like enzyme
VISLRQWSEKDFAAVRRILWETWLATYGSFVPEKDLRSYLETHYSCGALADLHARPEVRGYLAEVEGRPAAWMRTTLHREEGRLYVSSLYVLPAEQGGGIGSRLLGVAEGSAREHAVTQLWLGVMEQNVEAVAWYRKKGFRFVTEEPFTMGETTINHLIGYRALPPTQ